MSTPALLVLLSVLAIVAGIALYLAYVFLGVWRHVFWESIALLAAALALASTAFALSRAPLVGLWVVGATTVLVGFILFTSVVIRNPRTLVLLPGDDLPPFRLADETGRPRSFADVRGRRGLYLVVYRGGW